MATWYQSLASQSWQTAAHVWQPRNTSSVIFSKGLLNAPGENNCFLNSAVQVLWHLDVFRRSFREMGGHACMGKACIFCALKVLFTQLRYSDRQSLPPDALRKALAVAFKDELRFQLGCMDDAAECFENILTRIHFHLAHDIKEELCDAKHCIPHRKFAMTLIEHSVCSCGATSEPFPFTQMVHYVSCTALCAEAKKLQQNHKWSNSVCFGQVLRNAGAIGDIRACPSECGKRINIRRVLMNCPDVVAIGLVWDSDHPEKEHIVDVIQCLGTSLRMPDLFNSVVDDNAKQAALHLVGVVTYYGKHYSTFFYNTALRLWVYFDDATVKQVGPNWRDVVNRCKRGHSQPLLLLFANPNGTPVSTETAPKESTLLPGCTDIKSPAAVKSSGSCLHPICEYEAENESQDKSRNKPSTEKYVVEVGHDALKTIQAPYDSRQYTSQSSYSHMQGGRVNDKVRQPLMTSMLATKGYSSEGLEQDGHGFSHPKSTEAANKMVVRTQATTTICTPSLPYNTTNKNTTEISILSNDPKHNSFSSQERYKTDSNIPLSRSKGLPISHLGSSHPKDKPRNSDTALERHESWSGRPSQHVRYAPNTSQSRQYTDYKYALHRHNSFSHRAMPNSHDIYSSVPDLQQGFGIPSHLSNDIPHHKMPRSQSSFQYSSNNPCGLTERNKSLSVQNIPMATEGILAGAIRNQVKQKRTSSADLQSCGNRQSFASCSSLQDTCTKQYQESFPVSISTLCMDPMAGITTQSKKQMTELTDNNQPIRILTINQEDPTKTNGDIKAAGLESLITDGCLSRKPVFMGQAFDNMTCTNNVENTNIDTIPFSITRTQRQQQIPKCSPIKASYDLQGRDSVASKDSGYRSRDRSSASSGSLHSFETSATGTPIAVDTEKFKEYSGYQQALNQNHSTNVDHRKTNQEALFSESKTQYMKTVCDELFKDVAGLQAQSTKMEKDGDLAAALAMCTTVVTKLKDSQNLPGISHQTRQLLHNEYNHAVLQSRNLYRRLTLLRRPGSIPICHSNVSHDHQNATSRCRPSQPLQPAREVNLINLHESSTDTSRVDRLKQQLHELYIQKSNHKVNNMREDPVSFTRNDKSMTSTMQTSASTRTNALKAYDEKACIQTTMSHNGSMEMNRNQNACNDSCMDTSYHGYQPKAEEKHVMKLSYETVGENNTQDNIAPIRQSNITDNCTQEWMTHLQHKCDTVTTPNQHHTAHTSNY